MRTLTPQKYLMPDEVVAFQKTLDDTTNIGLGLKKKAQVKDAMILHTVLGGGLRVSEVCTLTMSDIFIGYGESELLIRDSKGGKTRSVRIGNDLKKKLKDFLKWKRSIGEGMTADDPVFLSERGGAFKKRAIQHKYYHYLKLAGIENKRGIHVLRHTFCYLLYKASGNCLRTVQNQAGHASSRCSEIYTHVLDTDLSKAVDKMFRFEEPKRSKKDWQLDDVVAV